MDEKTYEVNPKLRVKVKTDIYTKGIIPTKVSDLAGWDDLALKKNVEEEVQRLDGKIDTVELNLNTKIDTEVVTLNNKITEDVSTLNETISVERERIDNLEDNDKENIKHIPQELDEEQKQQARDNISVNSKLEIDELLEFYYNKVKTELNEFILENFENLDTEIKAILETELEKINIYLKEQQEIFEDKVDNIITVLKEDIEIFEQEIYNTLNKFKKKIEREVSSLKEELKVDILTVKDEVDRKFKELKSKNDLEHVKFKEDFFELEDIVRELEPFKRVDISIANWEDNLDDDDENIFKYKISSNIHNKGSIVNLNTSVYDLTSGKAKLVNEDIDIDNEGTIHIYSGKKWNGYILVGSNEQIRYELPIERMRILYDISTGNILYTDDGIVVGY